ncbi:MAG: glycosyltransferase family 2 protein [Eubacteriales bacterium]
MDNKIVISIIVPIFNSMDCLEKCVDSITSQTYQNLDIILVDDGSTDGTALLCEELAKKDKRIRVFHKQNGGSSSARNLGIKEAKGDYLGFIDSDDFISPEMYETLVNASVTYKVPIVQASRDEIDVDGNLMKNVCIPPEQAFLCSSEEFMKELLLHKGDCSFCTKLIARELLAGKSFPEGKLNEDFYLLIHLLQEMKESSLENKIKKPESYLLDATLSDCEQGINDTKENQVDGIYILPDQMYHVFYRIGSNTRKESRDEFSRVFMDIVDNADVVNEIVDNTYPNLKEVCIRFGLFQRLDYMLHIPVKQMTKENGFYQAVKKQLRKQMKDVVRNSYLSKKNKVYLLVLGVAPKSVRSVHQWVRRL